MTDAVDPKVMANAIRALAMDGVEKAKSGHPGMPMGMADVATVLFTKYLKFDPADPHWPDRDRFVLSAGHGSMLLYSLLYLTGYPEMTLDELKHFRQLHSKTPGHPESFMTPGVETTTGPLGQGVATSVGMALAERILAAEFGDDIVDHQTFVLCSDGDLMEGVSHEAIALAGHLQAEQADLPLRRQRHLDRRTADARRFRRPGGALQGGRLERRADRGSEPRGVSEAIDAALTSDRPSLIACKTVIGYGAPKKAGTSKAHGEALGADELAGAKKALGWDYGPFEVPDDILAAWRDAGKRGASAHADVAEAHGGEGRGEAR